MTAPPLGGPAIVPVATVVGVVRSVVVVMEPEEQDVGEDDQEQHEKQGGAQWCQ